MFFLRIKFAEIENVSTFAAQLKANSVYPGEMGEWLKPTVC